MIKLLTLWKCLVDLYAIYVPVLLGRLGALVSLPVAHIATEGLGCCHRDPVDTRHNVTFSVTLCVN